MGLFEKIEDLDKASSKKVQEDPLSLAIGACVFGFLAGSFLTFFGIPQKPREARILYAREGERPAIMRIDAGIYNPDCRYGPFFFVQEIVHGQETGRYIPQEEVKGESKEEIDRIIREYYQRVKPMDISDRKHYGKCFISLSSF